MFIKILSFEAKYNNYCFSTSDLQANAYVIMHVTVYKTAFKSIIYISLLTMHYQTVVWSLEF